MSKPRFKITSFLSLNHLAKQEEVSVDEDSEFYKKKPSSTKGSSSFSPSHNQKQSDTQGNCQTEPEVKGSFQKKGFKQLEQEAYEVVDSFQKNKNKKEIVICTFKKAQSPTEVAKKIESFRNKSSASWVNPKLNKQRQMSPSILKQKEKIF